MRSIDKLAAATAIACLAIIGCGQNGTKVKQIHGAVTCGGEPVALGQVTFVPIEGTTGVPASARIIDGRYSFQPPGGVSLGKHRVEVEAKKKTGRKVEGFNGVEMAIIDETISVGPEQYAGSKSPLIVEIKSDGDGRYDIELPVQ